MRHRDTESLFSLAGIPREVKVAQIEEPKVSLNTQAEGRVSGAGPLSMMLARGIDRFCF